MSQATTHSKTKHVASKKRAIVIGGSRGLGRAAVEALAPDYELLVIARQPGPLHELARALPVTALTGDATDEKLAERVLREQAPDLLVLGGGAIPIGKPLAEVEWSEMQRNWDSDAKLAFVWLRQALRTPLRGTHIIVVSSGAAIGGSPVSGGYAAAKRAQWFLASYAVAESERAQLGLRIHCLLPGLNPHTELGRNGVASYARRNGISDEQFIARLGATVTPAIFGAAVADLARQPEKWSELAYRVTADGLATV